MQVASFEREEAESALMGGSHVRTPIFSAKRSFKNNKSIKTLTVIDHKKQNPSLGMLLSPRKETAEIAIQTDNDGKRPINTASAKQFHDHDSAIMDWADSYAFKHAMAEEARKRGLEVKDEYKVDEITVDQEGYETQNAYDYETSARRDRSEEQLPNNVMNCDLGITSPSEDNKLGNL